MRDMRNTIKDDLVPPPSDFKNVYMPEEMKGTPVEQAAKNDWFIHGEPIESRPFDFMSVARTNNIDAIPPEAIAEIQNSGNCRPAENSQYWEDRGNGASFHTEGAPVACGSWQCRVFRLRENHDVVILCHQVDVP